MASLINPGFYFPMGPQTAYPALVALGFTGSTKGVVWSRTGINDGSQVQNQWTVTTAVTSAATLQSFRIYPDASPGSAVTISAYGSTTATLSATNLLNAIEASPNAFGLVSVTQVAGVLTLIVRGYGIDITVDSGTNVTPAETVSSAVAQRVGPGLALKQTDFNAAGDVFTVAKPVYTGYTALAVLCTYASVAAAGSAGVNIMFAGQRFEIVAPYNTSNTQTITDLVAKVETVMNAAFPAGQSVVATNPNAGEMLITADVAGAAFNVTPISSGTVAVVWNGGTSAPTYTSRTYCLSAGFAGISQFSGDQRETAPGQNDSAAAPNAGLPVSVGGPGCTFVPFATVPTPPGTPWVDLAAATAGTIQSAPLASSKYVPAWGPDCGWLLQFTGENDSTNGLAGVRVLGTR